MDTVAVTGATGTVGRHVRRLLADRAVAVRALARNPDRVDAPTDTDAVRFDFDDPGTWRAAFAGADALFLVRPPSMGRVDAITDAVDAAVDLGVSRVVFLSVLGAQRNPLLPHRRIERHLAAAPVDASFLRASFFMQNLTEVHGDDVRAGRIRVPAGGGETSFVDARDVAAVAAAALADDADAHRHYDVTGGDALTYGEVAAVLSAVLDHRVRYDPDPLPVFVAREARRRGVGVALVEAGVYTTARLGFADRVTDDVERVLGRPPRTLPEFARGHADELAAGSG
ncbi:NmrA family NAD(P)-binding protein [Halobacterium yunchengense]|uniref:NmrA family NAD(P)-binding protein n=1 Tax=Halobacterium yunchengense TaxID=3108497 RepID=UPI003008FDFC